MSNPNRNGVAEIMDRMGWRAESMWSLYEQFVEHIGQEAEFIIWLREVARKEMEPNDPPVDMG